MRPRSTNCSRKQNMYILHVHNQRLQKTFCAINLLLSAHTAVGIARYAFGHHIKSQVHKLSACYILIISCAECIFKPQTHARDSCNVPIANLRFFKPVFNNVCSPSVFYRVYSPCQKKFFSVRLKGIGTNTNLNTV